MTLADLAYGAPLAVALAFVVLTAALIETRGCHHHPRPARSGGVSSRAALCLRTLRRATLGAAVAFALGGALFRIFPNGVF